MTGGRRQQVELPALIFLGTQIIQVVAARVQILVNQILVVLEQTPVRTVQIVVLLTIRLLPIPELTIPVVIHKTLVNQVTHADKLLENTTLAARVQTLVLKPLHVGRVYWCALLLETVEQPTFAITVVRGGLVLAVELVSDMLPPPSKF